MAHLTPVWAANLNVGDLIDLTPLADKAVGKLSTDDRAAASDGYATVTAVSEHGGFVDVGTDIFDIQLRAEDYVALLNDD